MKRFFLCLAAVFIGLNASYAQVDVPYVSGAGPIGSGSWLRFSSGGSATSIQENWGLNLIGSNIQPVKIYNASLLVGYATVGADFGVGNAFISGNVAIGTISPYSGAKFQTKLNTDINLGIDAGAASGSVRLDAYNDAASANIPLELQGSSVSLYGNGGTLGLLVNPSGNVGIGTTTNLYGAFNVTIPVAKTSTTWSNPNNAAFFQTNDVVNPFALRVQIVGDPALNNRSALLQTTDINLADGGNLVLQPANGNVGIGTTNPGSYKLAVNGTIHSKSVIIDLIGWPDYVFKKDYKLMPLAQVKTYIDQNQHLPGLPTDKQVESKGLDVGEMNKLLTKKVEELTLYLIDLKAEKDKKEKEQQAQIDQLKKQVDVIMKSINKN